MRIALLSDVHANEPALQAVLDDARQQGAERFWFLGDSIGYGPDPVAAVDWLRESVAPQDWVLGNHEAMLAGLLTPQEWVQVDGTAKHSIAMHGAELAGHPEAWDFCQAELTLQRASPLQCPQDGVDYLLVHSGQVSHLYRYIYGWQREVYLPAELDPLCEQVRQNGNLCVQCFGHTHVPTLVTARLNPSGYEFQPIMVLPGQTYPLDGDVILLNPGSVGQPRDTDQRAAYAILDTGRRAVTFRRVGYDWLETVHRLNACQHRPDLCALVGEARLRQVIDRLVKRLRDAPPYKETPQDWLAHYARAREVEG